MFSPSDFSERKTDCILSYTKSLHMNINLSTGVDIAQGCCHSESASIG